MAVLPETKEAVLKQLDRSALGGVAFDCRFDAEDGALIAITLPESDYLHLFIRRRPSPHADADKPWEVRESPGPLFRGAETLRFQTFEESVDHIAEWAKRAAEEVRLFQARRSQR